LKLPLGLLGRRTEPIGIESLLFMLGKRGHFLTLCFLG
jgi:hypothetical protein